MIEKISSTSCEVLEIELVLNSLRLSNELTSAIPVVNVSRVEASDLDEMVE